MEWHGTAALEGGCAHVPASKLAWVAARVKSSLCTACVHEAVESLGIFTERIYTLHEAVDLILYMCQWREPAWKRRRVHPRRREAV